jgi:hypothetical protein
MVVWLTLRLWVLRMHGGMPPDEAMPKLKRRAQNVKSTTPGVSCFAGHVKMTRP